MAVSLVTLCSDDRLACKISDYLQKHWDREPCYRYISGSSVELLDYLYMDFSCGDKLVVLVEDSMVMQVRHFIKHISIQKNLAEDNCIIGTLCAGNDVCKHGAMLFGSPDSILSLAYSLVGLCRSKAGIVSLIYPSSRAASFIKGVDLHKVVESLGEDPVVFCTDEYGIGQGVDQGFLKLLCHGVMGNVGPITNYTKEYMGVKLLDAKGCAPEIYELNKIETQELVKSIGQGVENVVLAVLGSGTTTLNLELIRHSRSIICVGAKDDILVMLDRYFGEDFGQVCSKIVEVPIEEYERCRELGEWSSLWQRI